MERRPHPAQPSNADPHGATSANVRGALAGDTDCLEWVVRRLSPFLLAHARYRLRALSGVIEAEDVLQDTWLKTIPRFDDLRPRDGRFTPVLLRFMTTIINRRIRDLLQKQMARVPMVPVGDASAELPADTSDVISRVIREERRDLVWEALHQLAPADREVVILRGIEQNPLKVVAAVLQVSPEAVRKHYRRVLKQLRFLVPDSVFAELSDAD